MYNLTKSFIDFSNARRHLVGGVLYASLRIPREGFALQSVHTLF